jgi:hypothetical protein
MVLEVYFHRILILFLGLCSEKGRISGLSFYAVPRLPTRPIYVTWKFYPLSFANKLKRLPDLCMCPNKPLHTQVWVSLVRKSEKFVIIISHLCGRIIKLWTFHAFRSV